MNYNNNIFHENEIEDKMTATAVDKILTDLEKIDKKRKKKKKIKKNKKIEENIQKDEDDINPEYMKMMDENVNIQNEISIIDRIKKYIKIVILLVILNILIHNKYVYGLLKGKFGLINEISEGKYELSLLGELCAGGLIGLLLVVLLTIIQI